MSVEELRDLLASHEAADNWRLFRMALDVMQSQQKDLIALRQELEQVKIRNDTNLAYLAKRIDRINGIHGA